MRRWLMLGCLLFAALGAQAAQLDDATGRSVTLREPIRRVLPAGPPAAVLMTVLAPDLMIGWPHTPSAAALAWLPESVRTLPAVGMLTGRQDLTGAVPALHPDLILDYGTVSARYADLDRNIQEKTGVPTVLLDGALAKAPQVLRNLGAALGRPERAEQLALAAEAVLAAAHTSPLRVIYARGPDGLDVAAPGTATAETFAELGWTVLAPAGEGTFRHTDLATIQALDPDLLIFQDAVMRKTVAQSPEWSRLRAVRQHRAYVAPELPFGWLAEPPSINRLLGLAAIEAGDRGAENASSRLLTLFFGREPDEAQRAALRRSLQPIEPQ